MRDRNDNVVVVCPIENVDPVGVHTGDSITVAPCFTLTDREYQKLRDIGIAIIRGVGVDTGGCNIQFAVHPDTGRIIVIEMNPRVSRSSALASKATGFPIAKIATKLPSATRSTRFATTSPSPRRPPSSRPSTTCHQGAAFRVREVPGRDPTLTTSMKSVGEAMALAGNFQESLGKAMRSIDKRHMASTGMVTSRPRTRFPSCSTPSSADRAPLSADSACLWGAPPKSRSSRPPRSTVVHPPVRAHQRDCAGS